MPQSEKKLKKQILQNLLTEAQQDNYQLEEALENAQDSHDKTRHQLLVLSRGTAVVVGGYAALKVLGWVFRR